MPVKVYAGSDVTVNDDGFFTTHSSGVRRWHHRSPGKQASKR